MSDREALTITSENAERMMTFSEYRKTALTRISDRTVPPGVTYQTPEGLRAEDEDTRIAFDVQGGIYPIRESVFQASYARAEAVSLDGLDVERLARALNATRHRITRFRVGDEPWHEKLTNAQVVLLDLRRAIEAEAAAPSLDEGLRIKTWLVRLTCCHRADGVFAADTWEEAEAFREAYTSGPEIKGGHIDDTGHDRSAVILNMLEPVVGLGSAAPSAPSRDEGLREALQAAFAAMDGTLFWSHGSQCPLRYNVNLPDPCTCGVDVAQSALRDALAQEGETP